MELLSLINGLMKVNELKMLIIQYFQIVLRVLNAGGSSEVNEYFHSICYCYNFHYNSIVEQLWLLFCVIFSVSGIHIRRSSIRHIFGSTAWLHEFHLADWMNTCCWSWACRQTTVCQVVRYLESKSLCGSEELESAARINSTLQELKEILKKFFLISVCYNFCDFIPLCLLN